VDAPVEVEDPNLFETFKRNVFAIIDRMIAEMSRRFFDCNKETMKGIDALTPSSENFLNKKIDCRVCRRIFVTMNLQLP
jgi:hypothetical protein